MSLTDKIREGPGPRGPGFRDYSKHTDFRAPEATAHSISGNAIHGGKIIKKHRNKRDLLTRTSLLVEDDPNYCRYCRCR